MTQMTQMRKSTGRGGSLRAAQNRYQRVVLVICAHLRHLWISFLVLAVPCCGGPEWEWPDWTKPKQEKPAAPAGVRTAAESQDPSLQGTIRSYAYVEGMRKIRVRGYGIVGNLANTGGSDSPDVIRKYLEKEIRRRNSVQDLNVDPREIFSDKQFAPVVVTAEIPAAVNKGARFDVIVRALGNQTTSLEDGYLFFCELKPFRETPRGIIEGRTVAEAHGPIYISPFGSEETASTPTDPRIGRVLGGGVLKEDRRLRLVLNSPSYTMARMVRDRLNGRYGGAGQVADAVSPTTIPLSVPGEHREDAAHFMELVLHTIVQGDPPALQRRAAELAEAITHPMASYEDIALTWEAIGRTIVPILQRLYDHRTEAAAYYAARTGLRLGDELAVEVIGHHAGDAKSPFREQAVRELTHAADLHRTSDRLRMLLRDPDNRIRILAYEGLRRRRDRAIETRILADQDLVLDVIDCGTENAEAHLIYARQSEEQRLAVFGRSVTVRPPVMYSDRREVVTISARANDDHVRVIRGDPVHHRTSDPQKAPLALPDLLQFLGGAVRAEGDRVEGLGLSYAVVVDTLDKLTKSGTLPATLILERPKLSEATGRMTRRERKESEF